jgi:FtsH-binding integral membrane protein
MAADGVEIEHPNRKKASSKATRVIVVVLLLVSALIVAVISVGAWDQLVGAKALQVIYIVLYVGLAYFVARWSRGVLPVVAALAILLAIFALVSVPGWYERDRPGFTEPALSADVVGLLTALLVPLQLALIAFAMRGFQQAWNVEVEHPVQRGGGGVDPAPAPA